MSDELKSKALRFFSGQLGLLDPREPWFRFTSEGDNVPFIVGGNFAVDRALIKSRGSDIVKIHVTMKEVEVLNALGAKIAQLIKHNPVDSRKLVITVIDINMDNPDFKGVCQKCDFECVFEATLSVSYNGEYLRP